MCDGSFVDARNFRARAVRALAARTNDSSVQHSRQTNVLEINIFAADLIWNVISRGAGADQFVVGDRFQRRGAREGQIETLVSDQLTIRDRLSWTATVWPCSRNDALRYRELIDGDLQFSRSHLQKRLPRFGCGHANRRAASSDGGTRVRPALIGSEIGVQPDGADLIHAEVEFFGGDLQ